MKWFLRVVRMESECILKKVMNARVNGVRARGTPRLGWMDDNSRALQISGMVVREVKECVGDRNDWRAIVRQF